MANYANLKAAVADVIKTNGDNEITGAILQAVLIAIVDSLGSGYQFADVATPSMNPGTPDQRVFYVASQPGSYPNFGNAAVDNGELCVFKYDTTWSKKTVVSGFATKSWVEQVQFDIDGGETAFRADGTIQDLSLIIRKGSLITGATGGAWTSLNFYDENGQNRVQLYATDLPHIAERDYYKASTAITGSPTINVAVADVYTAVAKNLEQYATKAELEQLDFSVNGGHTDFVADGTMKDLAPIIKSGSVITQITGGAWTSVNLYDENGNNRLQLYPADLPYKTTRDYYKASTHITGDPTLGINVLDLYGAIVSLFKNEPGTTADVLTVLGIIRLLKKASRVYLTNAKNYYANMSGLAVGDTFVLNETYYVGITFEDFAVEPGDYILLNTSGNTSNAKAYAIMDKDDVILQIAQGPITGTILQMPANARRIVVNSMVNGNQSLIYVLGKTGEIDTLNAAVFGIDASFKALGRPTDLSTYIPAGSLITAITGGNWTSVNLYDENEGNRLQLYPGDLPYITTMDYYMGSTFITGSPVLRVHLGGAYDLSRDLYTRFGGAIDAKKYAIGNHDNEFLFDFAKIGQLITTLIEMVPNFNVPNDGGFISTDVDAVGVRSEPVTDGALMRAFAPYFYLNGEKRGTIVLFDENGTPYIYDKTGTKRTLNLN